MANLTFNIELSSKADPNRTSVSNIGRVIVKKLAIKFDGHLILEVDDFDMFACYRDPWKTKSENRDTVRQGIIFADGCMANCIKLKINAKDKTASILNITLLPMYMGTSLLFLSTLKCWTV